jgi:hypothetical protein
MRGMIGFLMVLLAHSAWAQQWIVNGQAYQIFPQTSVRMEQGAAQAISPTLGPIYISRNEENGLAVFQVGGNPPITFLPGYIKLDASYYPVVGLVTIQPGEIFLGNSPMVNCRRPGGAPVLTTGAAVLRYGPSFDLTLALATGGYTNFLRFYTNANVYEAASATGDVVCDGALAPSPTLLPFGREFKDGFES